MNTAGSYEANPCTATRTATGDADPLVQESVPSPGRGVAAARQRVASQPSKSRSAARPSTDTDSVLPGGTSAAHQAAGASTDAAAPHAGVLPADPSVV